MDQGSSLWVFCLYSLSISCIQKSACNPEIRYVLIMGKGGSFLRFCALLGSQTLPFIGLVSPIVRTLLPSNSC